MSALERLLDLDRIARAYGELHFAVAFTDGIQGDAAKRITGPWDRAKPLPDGEFAAGLMRRCKARNPAIVVGASGLIGIDVDGREGLERFRELLGKLPPTVTVTTGKGSHLYFTPPNGAPPEAVFEFSAAGVAAWREKYFVAPPALHPSGRVYAFHEGRAPWEIDLAELPLEAIEAMRHAAGERKKVNGGAAGEPIPEGGRNDALFRMGCAMRRRGMGQAAIRAALAVENDARCAPPLADEEVAKIAESAVGYAPDQEPEQDDPAARDTWAPVADLDAGLVPPAPPSILRAEGGGAVLYAGMRHLLSGEFETLKSWLAAAAAVELLVGGLAVVWIDADDMGLSALVDRLVALGASMEQIRVGLLYLAPDRPLDDAGRAVLTAAIDARAAGLAVIDALDPALELQGLEPNGSSDVQRFYREVVGLFHRRGIATLIIDHVTKDREARGRYSIGSQRKATGIDVHIGVELIGEPMTRARPNGRVVVRAHKDRPGWHDRAEGRRIGEFVLGLESSEPWRVVLGRSAASAAEDRGFRPTFLMERVSAYLATSPEPVSAKRVEEDVKGKRDAVRLALRLLVEEGYVEVEEGPRSARLHRLVRVYREADDDLAGPRPDLAPGEVRDDHHIAPETGGPPYGGAPPGARSSGDHREVDLAPDTGARS